MANRFLRATLIGLCAYVAMASFALIVTVTRCLISNVACNYAAGAIAAFRGAIGYGLIVTVVIFFSLRQTQKPGMGGED